MAAGVPALPGTVFGVTSFDTVIGIVAMIVWILVQVTSKRSQKPGAPRPQGPQPTTPGPFESPLDELRRALEGLEPRREPPPPPLPPPVPVQQAPRRPAPARPIRQPASARHKPPRRTATPPAKVKEAPAELMPGPAAVAPASHPRASAERSTAARVLRPQPSERARRLQALLRNRETARDAWVASELLRPPLSLRPAAETGPIQSPV